MIATPAQSNLPISTIFSCLYYKSASFVKPSGNRRNHCHCSLILLRFQVLTCVYASAQFLLTLCNLKKRYFASHKQPNTLKGFVDTSIGAIKYQFMFLIITNYIFCNKVCEFHQPEYRSYSSNKIILTRTSLLTPSNH